MCDREGEMCYGEGEREVCCREGCVVERVVETVRCVVERERCVMEREKGESVVERDVL